MERTVTGARQGASGKIVHASLLLFAGLEEYVFSPVKVCQLTLRCGIARDVGNVPLHCCE